MYFAHYDDGEHLINNEATKSFFIVRAWSTKVSLLKPSGITMLSRCEAVEAVWAPASILSICLRSRPVTPDVVRQSVSQLVS